VTRRVLLAAIPLFIVLGLASPAEARPATSAKVADLAAAAASGRQSALRALKTIDEVDGSPADLAAALDAHGADLVARLEVLANLEPPPAIGDPQGEARDILSQPRFRPTDLPQPLRGPLEALADRIRDLGDPLSRLVNAIPGEGSVEWIVLSIIVAVLAGYVALRLARRRARLRSEPSVAGIGVATLDPAALEGDAARAERDGDLERALRLRFAAGLLRLDRRQTIRLRPSLTTGDVARRLGSPHFDRVATVFDEVVYGRREPTDEDVEISREGWRKVLTGASVPSDRPGDPTARIEMAER
jgi:hypothetical protein